MIAAPARPKAFAVWFKDLDRWDVSYFRRVRWAWPKEVMHPIGQALTHQTRQVDPKADKTALPIIEKISFGGRISLSDPHGRAKYKGRLFWAEAGDLVYSKIRVKQGSLAVVPTTIPRLAVSAEYPVYTINPAVADGRYLVLAVKSRPFQDYLEGLAHGGSTKTRIHPTDFESLVLPLPPLPVQQAIVRRWREGQDAAHKARQAVAKIEKDILAGFLKALGLEPPKTAYTPKALAVWWKDFLRWSVSYNQAALNSIDLSRGRYPVVDLGSVLAMVQYGTSQKANTAGQGTPIIRMNNIVDGELRLDDLKHAALSPKERARLQLKDGDILFNRTNSKELVGKCAVFHEASEFVFASYLIRLHPDEKRANPDYLATFINSPLGRQQIDALSRHIIGQANVNSMELRSLRICLPPLAIQKAIMGKIAAGKAEVARERQAAAKLSAEVAQEVEDMILGKRPVKGAKVSARQNAQARPCR
jgi:type I restriction enzyme S subunit